VTEFQALVTGALVGAMLRAHEFGVLVEVVQIDMDESGHYGPGFTVRGKTSGESVRVEVRAPDVTLDERSTSTPPGVE
jgi:hypothetical protein